MEKLVIYGGNRLTGEMSVHGSKNSALPILAATALTGCESVIHNCPRLSDVDAAIDILKSLGCKVKRENDTVTVNSCCLENDEVPVPLMQKMRSSVIFMGAMLGRNGKAVLSAPGGCEIGLRPIDMHIGAVKALGVSVTNEDGRLYFTAENGLKGAKITLPFPSVGATENVMLTACVAKGTTVLDNAAREPEITDLADFLNKCGARIYGAGDSTLIIKGVGRLHPAEHTVIPDRIAAASYLLCAAVTQGNILINEITPKHIAVLLPVLQEMGCIIKLSANSVRLVAPARLSRVEILRTMPYPGFPTDIQAPMTAALSVADGTSVMIENIFESRYKHISELLKLGANISVEGRMAVIRGVPYLSGALLRAPDLRGGFALITAALAARGESEITHIEHIYRGYEEPEHILESLGADIKRI